MALDSLDDAITLASEILDVVVKRMVSHNKHEIKEVHIEIGVEHPVKIKHLVDSLHVLAIGTILEGTRLVVSASDGDDCKVKKIILK